VQRHHRGFLASFEADARVRRLQLAYSRAHSGEAAIYRLARDAISISEDPVLVGHQCYCEREILLHVICEFAPELVGPGLTSFQVFDSIYWKVRRNATAKMRRRVNLGSARRHAGY
jgi:hypothetical protein